MTGQSKKQLVSEPVRIGLRLFGALLLLIGTAMIALLIYPGPRRMAYELGHSCSVREGVGYQSEQCTVIDVLGIAWYAPMMIFIGLVLVLVMRRSFVQPDPPRHAGNGTQVNWTPIGNEPRLHDPEAHQEAVEQFLREWRVSAR